MPAYLRLGSLPAKRHTRHSRASGDEGFAGEGLYYEHVISAGGFDEQYTICYHLRPPTRLRAVEPAGHLAVPIVGDAPLRPYHLRGEGLPRRGDPIRGRVAVFANADVTVWRCRPAEAQATLFRNAGADELIYIHHGAGTLETPLGVIAYRPLDYLVIPRATTYRLVPANPTDDEYLILECPGLIGIPRRYTNRSGQLRLGAPYAERDLHGPSALTPRDDPTDTEVLVKDASRLTRHILAHHPFDVVGWDGCHYPLRLNALDFEPLTGTVHQPPPVHQTFEAAGLVVCTFAPRALDTHPQAIKVPYAHSNPHADEMLFYSRGQFGSRRGVTAASLTLHPRGLPHGPHPGTIAASMAATRTDELAVMMDTDAPLLPTVAALEALDDPAYPQSWL